MMQRTTSNLLRYTTRQRSTTSSLHLPIIITCRRSIHIEKKLKDLKITLPPPPQPKANYNIVCHASSNMLYISGHLPITNDGELLTGVVGDDGDGKSIEEGYAAARLAALNMVSTMKEQLGDLDRVEQVVKVCICGRRFLFVFVRKIYTTCIYCPCCIFLKIRCFNYLPKFTSSLISSPTHTLCTHPKHIYIPYLSL